MTYKSGIKEYATVAVIYGSLMGVFLGLANQSIAVGLLATVFCGVLFSFLIFLFSKPMEKKFSQKMRAEIEKEQRIICDGAATIQGNGGWLFLLEDAILFCPHKINFSTKKMKIPLSVIESVKAQKNQIVITTFKQTKITVIVCQNKEWQKQIEAAIGALAQK